MSSDTDLTGIDWRHMAHALRLAHQGRFWARPNPNVGCVLAKGNDVLATGFTQPTGGITRKRRHCAPRAVAHTARLPTSR